MATRKSSQAQQNPTPSFPMPGLDVWRSMFENQTERMEQMLGELERLERERHERMLGAIDDVAKLMKSTLEYQSQLTAQWRELTVEATKKGVAAFTPAS